MITVPALAHLLRLGWRLEQAMGASLAGLGEGLGTALTVAERQALTLALYEAAGAGPRSLFPWEIQWLADFLPPPPARILVAGAGSGAEVSALRAQSYAVAATEPVARLARLCTHHAEAVWVLDHERLGELAGQRFDAVLFGWGSLTHVLSAEGRGRALAAAAGLTTGPILASFWTADSVGPPPAGRVVALAARTGRTLGRLRGVPPPTGQRFFPWCGFGCALARTELEAVGQRLGRRVAWGEGPYPHAALLPLPPAGPNG